MDISANNIFISNTEGIKTLLQQGANKTEAGYMSDSEIKAAFGITGDLDKNKEKEFNALKKYLSNMSNEYRVKGYENIASSKNEGSVSYADLQYFAQHEASFRSELVSVSYKIRLENKLNSIVEKPTEAPVYGISEQRLKETLTQLNQIELANGLSPEKLKALNLQTLEDDSPGFYTAEQLDKWKDNEIDKLYKDTLKLHEQRIKKYHSHPEGHFNTEATTREEKTNALTQYYDYCAKELISDEDLNQLELHGIKK